MVRLSWLLAAAMVTVAWWAAAYLYPTYTHRRWMAATGGVAGIGTVSYSPRTAVFGDCGLLLLCVCASACVVGVLVCTCDVEVACCR